MVKPMALHDIRPCKGAQVWSAKEFSGRDDWIHILSKHALKDIDLAVNRIRARGDKLDDVTVSDFDLPSLSSDLSEIKQILEKRRGFVLLKGLGNAGYGEEELELAFWGIGTHLGMGVSQSFRGDRLGHVRDLGEKDRYYTAGGELEMHMDPTDIAGLLCVQPSETGGLSKIASSLNVHNIILEERPELMKTLYEGFIYSRRQADYGGENQPPSYRIPVFAEHVESLICHFLPISVRLAALNHNIMMTDAEIEALALVGEVAQRPDVCIEMDFKHGDIQFLNNRVILHARTDYSDPEDPALKRHLLRLWLMVDSWPPLPQHMRMQGPTDRAGGGIARST